MDLAPGMKVTPNIELVEPLGKGGMGAVWIADHQGLDIKVAVKFIDATLAEDPSLMGRFKREAGAAARIRSPHVVQVFDHGQMIDGTPYIVMELLEGQPLSDRTKRGG